MADFSSAAANANALIGDAAAPYALITSATRYIGTLIFDVTVREVHSDEFTITTHPVETGTPISDHYFANPKVVEIVCGSSDSTAGYSGYVLEVYEAMQALAATRQTFAVSTGKRFYPNMMFANFSVVTDETSEWTLMVTARLQEVIMTSTSSSSSTGLTSANQGDPASTAPAQDVGTQTLQPTPSVTFPPETSTAGPGPGGGAGFGGGNGGSPFQGARA